MRIREQMAGLRFGRLVISGALFRARINNLSAKTRWSCVVRCDCGKLNVVQYESLTSGMSRSCGCLRDETATTHGLNSQSSHPERKRLAKVHGSMMSRCYNNRNVAYKNYGGRGITVCAEWHDIERFVDWAVMSGAAPGLSIDRIDNDGSYCPENCRFADATTQSRNRRNVARART